MTAIHNMGRTRIISFVIVIAGVGLIIYYYAFVWKVGLHRMSGMVNHMISRQSFKLDPNQPKYILENSNKEDGVLYLAEIPLYYFLAHGALDRGAVFMKGVLATADEKRWIKDNQSLRFVSTLNPISIYSDNLCNGGVCIRSGDILEVHFAEPRQLSSFRVSLTGNADEIGDSITFYDGKSGSADIKNLSVNKWPSQNWIYFNGDNDPRIYGFQIRVAKGGDGFEIHGIKLAADTAFYWPWNQGVTMTLVSQNQSSRKVQFEASQLYPGFDGTLKILMDSGSTVLAEIARKG